MWSLGRERGRRPQLLGNGCKDVVVIFASSLPSSKVSTSLSSLDWQATALFQSSQSQQRPKLYTSSKGLFSLKGKSEERSSIRKKKPSRRGVLFPPSSLFSSQAAAVKGCGGGDALLPARKWYVVVVLPSLLGGILLRTASSTRYVLLL